MSGRQLQPADERVHFPQHVGFIRQEDIVVCTRDAYDVRGGQSALEWLRLGLALDIRLLHLRPHRCRRRRLRIVRQSVNRKNRQGNFVYCCMPAMISRITGH